MSALLEALGLLGKAIGQELSGHTDRVALLEEEFAKMHDHLITLRHRLGEAEDRVAALEVALDAQDKLAKPAKEV